MAKNTFFFSHDGGARNDDKIIAVRMKHKAEGYAVYFMILEKLLESSDYMSVKDYNVLAFDFRVGAEVVKSVVEDFGLFEFTEDRKFFYSESFINRMTPLENRKEQKRIQGIRGNLIRYKHITKAESDEMTDIQILEFYESRKISLNDSTAIAQREISEGKNSHNIGYDNIGNNNIGYNNVYKGEKNKKNNHEIPQSNPNPLNSEKSLSEKEKSSAKKEKELEPFKKMLIDLGADENDVNEWFKIRIENRKQTTRYFVEKFTLECKKNNFSVKEAVYACAYNGWINFNYEWILNSKQTSNGKSKSDTINPDDPKIGRAKLSAYEKLHQQMAGG